jgi:hypothetical protein
MSLTMIAFALAIPPAPSPWMTRPAIMTLMLFAEPQTAHPAARIARAESITGLRPMISASPPVKGITAVQASV